MEFEVRKKVRCSSRENGRPFHAASSAIHHLANLPQMALPDCAKCTTLGERLLATTTREAVSLSTLFLIQSKRKTVLRTEHGYRPAIKFTENELNMFGRENEIA